jgi:DNA-binding response OmpR family regulator
MELMHILVIEDDAFLRKAYEVSLRSQGFEVSLAADGESGLSMAEAIQPDAIVLDVLLPMLTGIEVLRCLKKNPKVAGIPVLVFSVSCDPEEVCSILSLGAAAYISKSETDLKELGRRIRNLLSAGS